MLRPEDAWRNLMNFALLLPQLPHILASQDSFDAMRTAQPGMIRRFVAFWRRLKSGDR
jgi:hypothetical protein